MTLPKDVIRHILQDNLKKQVDDTSLVPAGVMLLVYPKEGEYCALLNKRAHDVEHHKNEISFPGGRKDEMDRTLLDTALRETYEEMGIRTDTIEVLGELGDTPTSTGFLMRTFVGTIPYPYEFNPSESEVAEVLEVPLSSLMDETNIRDEIRIVAGQLVNIPTYVHRGHLIHGATARVLTRFLALLNTAPDKEILWRTD